MNREIKFRAWDMDKKEMFVPMYLCQMDTLIVPFDGDYPSDVYPKSRPVELMQFTGLKDKHGKEIYEGDIVKAFADKKHPFYYEVMFDEKTACYWGNPKQLEHSVTTRKPLYEVVEIFENCEVIGNIYENPELIREETNE